MIKLMFNKKEFYADYDQFTVRTIQTICGFPDSNFVLLDKEKVIVRKNNELFLVTAERGPYEVIRSGNTTTRMFACFLKFD